jgi:hypothetical protein
MSDCIKDLLHDGKMRDDIEYCIEFLELSSNSTLKYFLYCIDVINGYGHDMDLKDLIEYIEID